MNYEIWSEILQICISQAPQVYYDADDLHTRLGEKLAEPLSWGILSQRSEEPYPNTIFMSAFVL